MLKDVIVSQLVHMLLSEESLVQRIGAFTLRRCGKYGEHELTWESLSLIVL